MQMIEEDSVSRVHLRVPQKEGKMLAMLEAKARIYSRKYKDGAVELEVEAPASVVRRVREWVVAVSQASAPIYEQNESHFSDDHGDCGEGRILLRLRPTPPFTSRIMFCSTARASIRGNNEIQIAKSRLPLLQDSAFAAALITSNLLRPDPS